MRLLPPSGRGYSGSRRNRRRKSSLRRARLFESLEKRLLFAVQTIASFRNPTSQADETPAEVSTWNEVDSATAVLNTLDRRFQRLASHVAEPRVRVIPHSPVESETSVLSKTPERTLPAASYGVVDSQAIEELVEQLAEDTDRSGYSPLSTITTGEGEAITSNRVATVTQAVSSLSTGVVTQLGALQTLVDLDGDDSTATGNDFATTFVEESGYVRLLDEDFVFDDLSEADTTELIVRPTSSVPDGSQEFVIFRRDGGVSSVKLDGSEAVLATNSLADDFEFEYQFDQAEGGLVFRPSEASAFPASSIQLLLEGLRYYNTDDDPDTNVVRTIEVFSRDNSGVTSTVGTASIAVSQINDPPTLDLDGDDSSNADPVVQGVDSAPRSLPSATQAVFEMFDGGVAIASGPNMTSSVFTATEPSFVNRYFTRGSTIRIGSNSRINIGFVGAAAPAGTLLVFHDVDSGEALTLSSSPTTPTLLEHVETTSGESTQPPTWNENSGLLQAASENGAGGATIFDVSGVESLSIDVADQGAVEFGFITPRQIRVNYSTEFEEGSRGVSIVDTDVDLRDVDGSTISRIQIDLTDGLAGDQIQINEASVAGLGLSIAGAANTPLAQDGSLSIELQGAVTQAEMESVLRGVLFQSELVNPVEAARNLELVAYDESDGSIAAQSIIAVVDVDPELVLTKTVDSAQTEVGDVLTYQLTVRNDSVTELQGIRLTETLPAGTTFVAEGSTNDWAENGDGNYVFSIDELTSGESRTVEFAVRVDAGVASVSSVAMVEYDGRLGEEANLSNNSVTVETPLVASDGVIQVTVFQDVNGDGILDGEPGIRAASVKLSGTSLLGTSIERNEQTDSSGVARFDQLSEGNYRVSQIQPDGFRDGSDSVQASSGSVVANDVAEIQLSAGEQAQVEFAELVSPDLSVRISDGNTVGEHLQEVAYRITASNVSSQPSSGVTLVQQLPQGSEFVVESSSTGWTDIGKGRFQYLIGDLGANESRELSFVVRVVSPDVRNLTATVSVADDGSAGGDTVMNNNSATDSTPVSASNSRISGFVFDDLGKDGQRDAVDTPISGVVVRLNGELQTGNTIFRQVVTNTDGEFAFENLPAGTYTLSEVQPDSYIDGADSTTASGARVVGGDAIQLTLGEGESQQVSFSEQREVENITQAIRGRLASDFMPSINKRQFLSRGG